MAYSKYWFYILISYLISSSSLPTETNYPSNAPRGTLLLQVDGETRTATHGNTPGSPFAS